MILSMTGYGKSSIDIDNVTYYIELKALNAKTVDIRSKLPANFAEREMTLRKLITDQIVRGRIEFNVSSGIDRSADDFNINTKLLLQYFSQLQIHQEKLGISNSDIFQAVMRIPSVTESLSQPITDDQFGILEEGVNEAIQALIQFRKDEGQMLENDLKDRIKMILTLLDQIEPFESARIPRIKEKIRKNFDEFIVLEKIDLNRFEQELLYYIEKLDISEEKSRLKQHCSYFMEQTHKAQDPGRILGFISQEMGREINTLGSKAQDSDMQQIIVQMKDELEKIKEQIANCL